MRADEVAVAVGQHHRTVPRARLCLVAAALVTACGAAPPPSPVHHRGTERFLDLGDALELVLDPSTDERFVRVTERKGDRELSFSEKDAEGAWARLEIHRFPIDPETARTLQADPDRLKGHHVPDGPARLLAAAGTQALVADTTLPYGSHHEDMPGGGHSTVEDLPRYQWIAAVVTPSAVVVVIYIADLARPEDRELVRDEALRVGRERHGGRAAGLLERLRRRR
jgi:hypothetical protein